MRSAVRPSLRLAFFLLTFAGFAVGVACSGDGSDPELDLGPDSSTPSIRADARTNGPDAEAATSTMRLAHLAAETGPIDFCYQEARTGTFIGPVLGGPRMLKPDGGDAGEEGDADAEVLGDASDNADARTAESPTVAYGTVTKYLLLEGSGPITVALVEAGATSCANPIVKADVTLDPGKLFTLALFSRPTDGGTSMLELGALTDDRTTPNDKMRVRVVHAALGTKASLAAGPLAVRVSGAKTTVLADRVEPRRAATASDAVSVDALGYVTAAPVPPPATIAIGPAATDGGADAGFEPWLSKPASLGLTGGSLHTAFILPGATTSTFAVLWCADTTTDESRTMCSWVR